MEKGARALADRIRDAGTVKVVTHIDADGLASGAVAARALERLGVDYEVEFLKSLTPGDADRLLDENPELLWFTDLGSGAASRIIPHRDADTVISDHHVPTASGTYHLNCHFHGEDGSRFLSGSTTTYLVARRLDRANRDMAGVAIVGCVGDLQDTDEGRLTGMNRVVLEDAASHGVLVPQTDVRYFGRETRTLPKLLQYADDPPVPGASGHADACVDLLAELGVDFKVEEAWRHWTHLSKDERSRILSTVAKRLLRHGYGHHAVHRLLGEVYVLPGEATGSPLRDAKEFATVLNSTARYGENEVGLAVAMGDRGAMYERALELRRGHARNLVDGMNHVLDHGIQERDHLQWFHAGSAVRETIVGIVAGMLYNKPGVRRDLPIIAFADADPGFVKVSGRAHRALVAGGVDLSAVMSEASKQVGGAGGGHAPAAGATIPVGHEEAFLDAAEAVLARQTGG